MHPKSILGSDYIPRSVHEPAQMPDSLRRLAPGPGRGMSILRQLPIRPVLRHSILPSLQPGAGEDKLINCGRRCVGKSQESVPRMYELRIVLEKLYAVGSFGVHYRLFEQEFDPDIPFGCGTRKLMHYSGPNIYWLKYSIFRGPL